MSRVTSAKDIKKKREVELTPEQLRTRQYAISKRRTEQRHPHPDRLLNEKELMDKYGCIPAHVGFRYRPDWETKESWKARVHAELQDQYPATGYGYKNFEERTPQGEKLAKEEFDKQCKREAAEWHSQHPGWYKMMGCWFPPDKDLAESMTVSN